MPNPPAKILGPNGKPFRSSTPRDHQQVVRSKYDAAQTSPENAAHWINADGLSARAANSPEVRAKLRNRARYERDNNTYCSGIVKTISNDLVGTGPRLQLLTEDDETNKRVAEAFEEWTSEVGLAEKLRTYRQARAIDGEAFALFTTNRAFLTPVQLDLRLVEADQISTPTFTGFEVDEVDGIRFDADGNPTEYHLLSQHPGDSLFYGTEYHRVPARLVRHWFEAVRPEQRRGVPEITQALPLFAMLRRYTLATLSAAEIAALFAAVLKSSMPPEDDDPGLLPFDTQGIVRGMMTALPDGYDLTQLKAEQPTTTYPAFKHEILNEIARCLNVPYNIAAGNSSGYNYSSGRLDHQIYFTSIAVDRFHLETAVLRRLLVEWFAELRLADPELYDSIPPFKRFPKHQWFWDGQRHVDPDTEANAQETRLRNGTTTLADEWGEAGYDWREKADQQAIERKYYASKGIPYPGDVPPVAPAQKAKPPTNGGGNADPATAND